MTAAVDLSHADWCAIEREYCERHLRNFVGRSWHVLEPATEFVPGWHIDAICEHLEAVIYGQIRLLLINIPPRHMKSLLAAVDFPAWVWTKWPEYRWLCASYAQALANRDSLKTRRVILSPWYQELWGHKYQLTNDQNAKVRFENDRTGYRMATSVGSIATGEGGDTIVVDDPHSAQQARSVAERENALLWWDETMSNRLNDPNKGGKIIVMQRLHERDLSGHVLAEGGYEHLCLPAEFEPERRAVTSIGRDPRQEPGEPIWPERMSPEYLAEQARTMGEVGYAGQYQQRPMPRGGGMFKVSMFGILDRDPDPRRIKRAVRYWDKAATEGGGARSAGVRLYLLDDGSFVVSDVQKGQWSVGERERRIKQTAEIDGKGLAVWIEQEPGSGGKESAQSTIRNLAGWNVRADKVSGSGSKTERSEPFAAQVEAGNVWLVRADWNQGFMDECELFPVGQYKDQVDAASGAFNKLQAVQPAQSSPVKGLV